MKSIDVTVSAESTAGLARSKVLKYLENEPGLKVRPVVVPGTGMTAYTKGRCGDFCFGRYALF